VRTKPELEVLIEDRGIGLFRGSNIGLFIVFILLWAYFFARILWKTFGETLVGAITAIFGGILDKCCGARKSTGQLGEATQETYIEAVEDMKATGVTHSYEIGANPLYRDAYRAIQNLDAELTSSTVKPSQAEEGSAQKGVVPQAP